MWPPCIIVSSALYLLPLQSPCRSSSYWKRNQETGSVIARVKKKETTQEYEIPETMLRTIHPARGIIAIDCRMRSVQLWNLWNRTAGFYGVALFQIFSNPLLPGFVDPRSPPRRIYLAGMIMLLSIAEHIPSKTTPLYVHTRLQCEIPTAATRGS